MSETKDKLSAGEILQKLNNDVKALSAEVAGLKKVVAEQADDLQAARTTNATVLQDHLDQISKVSQALFVAFLMHLDLVAPKRNHPDPDVAAEAKEHTNLCLGSMASIMPEAYEAYMGLDATTGEVLPGREPGVPSF